MNKWIVSIAIVGAVIALAWVNRIELLLTLVKFQSGREFVIEPERELHGRQGQRSRPLAMRNRLLTSS